MSADELERTGDSGARSEEDGWKERPAPLPNPRLDPALLGRKGDAEEERPNRAAATATAAEVGTDASADEAPAERRVADREDAGREMLDCAASALDCVCSPPPASLSSLSWCSRACSSRAIRCTRPLTLPFALKRAPCLNADLRRYSPSSSSSCDPSSLSSSESSRVTELLRCGAGGRGGCG